MESMKERGRDLEKVGCQCKDLNCGYHGREIVL